MRHVSVVSGGARDDAQLPMVLVLHGRGDRPRPAGFAQRAGRVRWVMPFAPTPHGAGFSWFPYETPEDLALPGHLREQAGALARFVLWAKERYPTPEGRIVVCGVSQGGMLAFALGSLHPDTVRASVPVMGLLPRSLVRRTERQVMFRAVHGTSDEVVPLSAGERAVTWLRGAGRDATLTTVEGSGHEMTPAVSAAMEDALRDALAGQ